MLTMLFCVANFQLSIVNCQLGVAFAQAPRIGGNVYGGGNQANVDGSTKVTVLAGDIGVRPKDYSLEDSLLNHRGKLFGGARMANVGGNTFVNIDGENATDYILINYVYGGNDIAGTIGTAEAVGETLPSVLVGNEDGVDATWNTYVHLSSKTASKYTASEAEAYNAGLTGALAAGTALTGTTLEAVNALTDVSKEYNSGDEITAADAALYNASLPGAVSTSDMKSAAKTYLGQLFAGGNGEYDYDSSADPGTGKTTHYIYNKGDHTTPIATKVTTTGEVGFNTPEVEKAYLDVQGGSIVYAYGGGNDATVTEKTVIHVDNPSEVVNSITDARSITTLNATGELLTTGRFLDMGINTGFSYPSSDAFQIGRFFGGNNRADMAIRPTWNLKSGKIRNLYSGGNRGRMIHENGIFMEIPATSTLVVDNLYGGCRMADVRPMTWDETAGKYVDVAEVNNDIPGTKFPRNLAARVIINGGDVNNVYGGNDVTGRVYFGNAVGIYSKVHGNVYGGGNGAYPYTDNPALASDPKYADLYYKVPSDKTSVQALNDFRPNAEQVSILVRGTEAKPTVIQGSVYVGGNCASLVMDDAHRNLQDYPLAEFKMGSHVKVDKVFLGNNGEGMVTTNPEERDARGTLQKVEGVLRTYKSSVTGSSDPYNSMNLLNSGQMATYMQGLALDHIPRFVLEDTKRGDPQDYLPYTSYIGSLFYGGNRGSMTYGSTNNIDFENRQIYIYDKLVAGCNNANVKASDYNAAYEGGILGTAAERGNIINNKTAFQRTHNNRIVMDLSMMKMTSKRWDDTFALVASTDPDITDGKLKAGEEYYATKFRSSAFIADGTEDVNSATYYRLIEKGTNLIWNTAKWDTDEDDFMPTGTETVADDNKRRLLGGNIYGGCYTSGHVNGNVVININNDLLNKDEMFAESSEDTAGNLSITGTRNSGVIYDEQAVDVMTVAFTVFGGGYGKDTEIWGGTTVNHNNGFCFQIFGGGEEGMVGKSIGTSSASEGNYEPGTGEYTTNGKLYKYDSDYSTRVHLKGPNAGYSEEETGSALAETEYLYAGGNEGGVCGDTYTYLGNGRVYDAFGGSSNADILGATEVHIGYDGGFPWIRDNVYGGNDFGGTVRGMKSHLGDLRRSSIDGSYLVFKTSETGGEDQKYALAYSSTYVKYIQGRVDSIFGGNYGFYDYKDRMYKAYTDADGLPLKDNEGNPLFSFPHLDNNSFVYFKPANNPANENNVGIIFGGSVGLPGHPHMSNTMQEESYVLIDDYLTTDDKRYAKVDIYGGGAYAGLGNSDIIGGGRSVVDLYTGKFHNAYGGSNREGLIGYTRVNVPKESTINVNAIFGGGQGYDAASIAAKPALAARYCDHYVTCVDYQSENAIVKDAIYGGNENRRVAFDTYVNIEAPVYQELGGYTATIYGGGHGTECVSGRTNVYMNKGSDAYKVFGGGNNGNVYNFESLKQWLARQFLYEDVGGGLAAALPKVKNYGLILQGFKDYISAQNLVKLPKSMPTYDDNMFENIGGTEIDIVNLLDPNMPSSKPLIEAQGKEVKPYFNTNVHIMQGGNVNGYAYGGGMGEDAVVSGTTYIELKGGKVDRDIYGGGQGGVVMDEYGLATGVDPNFVASTNVYIEGGTVRNVYGGGYLGHVGKHDVENGSDISTSYANDILAVANVTIGIPQEELPVNPISVGGVGFDPDYSFHNGVPAILRNAYGGGEGGSVFGTTNVTINNGYIGYRYQGFVAVPNETKLTEGATYYTSANGEGEFKATGDETSNGSNYYQLTYKEELDDRTPNAIELAGNVFGGGYVVNSYVDYANVSMYGGTVRGSLYGGGEVGPIGRGTMQGATGGMKNNNATIFKAGKTHVIMYNGHVLRNVFGGGRGKDSWGGDGTMYMDKDLIPTLDLDCKGYVFGQTEVDIYGGEVGTDEGVSLGYGNVFGGGDEGCVYSAYELADGTLCIGRKPDDSERYDDKDEGYYYKYTGTSYIDDAGTPLGDSAEKHKTEDCKVLVEPWLQVKTGETVRYSQTFAADDDVPQSFISFLKINLHSHPEYQTYLDKINQTTGKASAAFTFDVTYNAGDYVPTAYLNTLAKKEGDTWPGEWAKLDAVSSETVGGKTFFTERGVIIHNAVFAGGNTPPGGGVSANAKFVYGNATASIHDVYHRDLITIGTGHTGGLYGDGNLTLVDGYRGLNITNYGTDFYAIDPEITIDKYNALPSREKAYYELRYKCVRECQDKYETWYKPEATDRSASTITTDELELLFVTVDNEGHSVSVLDPNGNPYVTKMADGNWVPNDSTYWVENGVCSRYAGRIMNTIQRADFCGVFGSRMVIQGAQDRVPETVDHTNYTINRVREVSLNKKVSERPADASNDKDKEHGNYFGIYSKVNFLGALTSDVDFGDLETGDWSHGDVRITESTESRHKADYTTQEGDTYTYGDADATYYTWKDAHYKDRLRNNGASHNLLALASGVYLELTTEKSTGTDLYKKDWGLITGVIELDLINVQPGMGGGYVYAKNVHGKRFSTGKKLSTLTELNRGAVTNKVWDYLTADGDKVEWQTSGNFVHSTQTIIDDCYNKGGKYLGEVKSDGSGAMPAHYWFIKGQVYVYDQYISAYTGSPNAYSETVEMPLTITSASHGKITLINVQPNRYAYYSNSGGATASRTKLGDSQKLRINSVDYQLNDPIDYWEWWKLSPSERELFVEETMVSVSAYMTSTASTDTIAAGQVKLPSEYATFKASLPTQTYTTDAGETVTVPNALFDVGTGLWVPADEIFRSSNNVSHDKGYILTYEVDNPSIWSKWYTEKNDDSNGDGTITKAHEKNQTGGSSYENGPTYYLNTSEGKVLGQREYEAGEVISDHTYYTYNGKQGDANYPGIISHLSESNGTQASFEPAYIVTGTIEDATNISTDPQTQMTLNPGVVVAKSQFTTGDWPDDMSGKVEPAYICTSTLQVSSTEYVTVGTCMTAAKRDEYIRKYVNTTGLDERISTLLTTKITGITTARIAEIQGGAVLTPTEEETLGTENLNALNSLLASKAELSNEIFVPAYYCTEKGNYGGNFYQPGKNYRGLETWSSMSEADRQYFTFNYDALDLLIDPTYPRPIDMSGQRYQYDGAGFTTEEQAKANTAEYSISRAVDYTATFEGSYKDDAGDTHTVTVTYPGTSTEIAEGAELTPEQFEALPNEKRHYSQVSVTDENLVGTKYVTYVVKNSFVNRDGPYAAGQTLTADEYNSLASEYKAYVNKLTFDAVGTYYYCRESYQVGENGSGVAVTNVDGLAATIYDANGSPSVDKADDVEGTYNSTTAKVPVGLVISKDNYTSLVNKQLGFSIHGTSPKELSTLYVTNESDIKDLSKEKIITVVYQYNYEESNESGTQITPVSEYHVLNIHINFRSGIPTVDDINAPDIVLPGYGVTIKTPNVTPGAYEVIGRGWELFSDKSYAENHTNGVDYTAISDPLYWYQDGYYIAYYAKTYLGKTYSNYVPVRVANYHDLKKVMDDKKHHLYVDYNRAKLKRDSKIYINNYTGEKDGVDLLKDFFELSLIDNSQVNVDSETGLITTIKTGDNAGNASPFAGHALLNISEDQVTSKIDDKTYTRGVKAGTNLEFYLRSDIDHTGKPWTAIGSSVDDPATAGVDESELCFKGNLHGDGHTISGLSQSLFENLCGNVYNLGVTGTFTGAGVADSDTKKQGYVESCWVMTSGTPASDVQAVFGNPQDAGREQTVNCYYPSSNAYTAGKATPMPDKAFYNGEVAYDLNNFYLYKRYCDNKPVTSGSNEYYYFKPGVEEPQKAYYESNEALCSSGYNNIQYVEERFADGDFRYAAGTIPTSVDIRHCEDATDVDKEYWFPIWPDDYLFFGQKLTYGYSETDAHQDVPTAIARRNGRLSQSEDANRVYRAPAYFRPNTNVMSMAYFNPEAYLLAKSYDGTQDAYPGMTAIDFAGHNDASTYGLGLVDGKFYPPLLDDDGLTYIMTRSSEKPDYSETQNLLVYSPAETAATGYANKKTFDILKNYFVDPEYSDYYDNSDGYRLVGRAPTTPINGHIVQSDLTATDDHLLVDKQDFSCPIEYSFDSDHLMWYQRLPENYIVPEWSDDATPVRTTRGWEGVSLPFTAELVTTDQKGEITHFYDGSDESKNGTETKVGHEYWLRQYRDITGKTGDDAVEARFTYPKKSDGAFMDKTRTNHFLWDYYYYMSWRTDEDKQHDYHKDDYQEYYRYDRTYDDYALLTAATPYIIGFPGDTYYEFDLSGGFFASTTADPNPARLEPQTITFASNKGTTVGVSFGELSGGVTENGYTFKPSYLNEEMPAGTYVLNSLGNAYSALSDEPETYSFDDGATYPTAEDFEAAGTLYTEKDITKVATSWTDGTTYYKVTSVTPSANETNKVTPQQYAFRPYFKAAGAGVKEYKNLARSIVFSRMGASLSNEDEAEPEEYLDGKLWIYSRQGTIIVKSGLNEETTVRIVNAGGALIRVFTIQPGETVTTRVQRGVYIVNTRKITVK